MIIHSYNVYNGIHDHIQVSLCIIGTYIDHNRLVALAGSSPDNLWHYVLAFMPPSPPLPYHGTVVSQVAKLYTNISPENSLDICICETHDILAICEISLKLFAVYNYGWLTTFYTNNLSGFIIWSPL